MSVRIFPFMKDFAENDISKINYLQTVSPLECLSKLRNHDHAGMYYQDTEYVDLIDAFYLQDGLDHSQVCIYATQSDPQKIRERMMNRGLRVDFYESENRLYICRLSDATKDSKGLSTGIQRILDYLMSLIDTRKSSRILSDPWVGEIATPRQVEANMEVERNVHAAFQRSRCDEGYVALKEFNGSLVCRYRIKNPKLFSPIWYRHHLLNHHKSILVPREGTGFAFNTHSKYFSHSA
jgi:hypothetical protein